MNFKYETGRLPNPHFSLPSAPPGLSAYWAKALGFRIEPIGPIPDIDVDPPICRCDIKNLMSYGHDTNCPEKRR